MPAHSPLGCLVVGTNYLRVPTFLHFSIFLVFCTTIPFAVSFQKINFNFSIIIIGAEVTHNNVTPVPLASTFPMWQAMWQVPGNRRYRSWRRPPRLALTFSMWQSMWQVPEDRRHRSMAPTPRTCVNYVSVTMRYLGVNDDSAEAGIIFFKKKTEKSINMQKKIEKGSNAKKSWSACIYMSCLVWAGLPLPWTGSVATGKEADQQPSPFLLYVSTTRPVGLFHSSPSLPGRHRGRTMASLTSLAVAPIPSADNVASDPETDVPDLRITYEPQPPGEDFRRC